MSANDEATVRLDGGDTITGQWWEIAEELVRRGIIPSVDTPLEIGVAVSDGRRVLRAVLIDGTQIIADIIGTGPGSRLSCTRCSHEWRQRGDDPPERCPGCNSPYWDRPYTKPGFPRPKG